MQARLIIDPRLAFCQLIVSFYVKKPGDGAARLFEKVCEVN